MNPASRSGNTPPDQNVQDQSGSQILDRFPGEEGTEAVVAKISGNRYSVALRDTDDDQYVGSAKIVRSLPVDYARIITRQTSIVSREEEADSRTADQKAKDKLLGEQANSGLAARPTKLNPLRTWDSLKRKDRSRIAYSRGRYRRTKPRFMNAH